MLRKRGFATAAFVANVGYCGLHTGLGRGFETYRTNPIGPLEILRASALGESYVFPFVRRILGINDPIARKDADRVNEEFLRWLATSENRPFFVFLNYFDAHNPYVAPPPYDERFTEGRSAMTWSEVAEKRVPDWVGPAIDQYDGAIAYQDKKLGELFRELERKGVLENTFVIVTSDHGEEFMEHGLAWHGRSLYLPSLHVPLVLSLPGRLPEGRRVTRPVSLRNLPQTVLDLLPPGEPSRIPGTSLAMYWREGHVTEDRPISGDPPIESRNGILSELSGRSWLPPVNPASRGNMQSLIFEGMHYIRNGDGTEELYDIVADPWERRDLAGSAKNREKLSLLRGLLEPYVPLYADRDVLR